MVGTAAAMCTDVAPYPDADEKIREWSRRQRKARVQTLPAPQPGDGIPYGQCARCGLVGNGTHPTACECISALRDRLARFE